MPSSAARADFQQRERATDCMANTAYTSTQSQPHGAHTFFRKLNGPWHRRTLRAFMIIVIAHWAEHLVQAYQVYVLGLPLQQALRLLGSAFLCFLDSDVLF